MKFKIGDSVITLVERGSVKEGDIGCIDAIHQKEDCYTVGFYATEDALLYSGRFRDEELCLAKPEEAPGALEEGDVVELLQDLPGINKGSIGEIVSGLDKDVYAARFSVPGLEIPLLMPVKVSFIKKLGHVEPKHHHH